MRALRRPFLDLALVRTACVIGERENNMHRSALSKIVALSICTFLFAGQASAAEIRALLPLAMKSALTGVIPQFEASSSNKVVIDYATVGAITDRLKKGEAADIAIVSDTEAADLQKQGKLVAGTQSNIARIGIGMFVHKGAAKPDISSVDAFKKTLLSAKSIDYADPAKGGPSGAYISSLLERLGIAAEMKPKTVLVVPGMQAATVAKGEAEIGFDQMSGAVDPSVDLVGPLPAALQNYTNYTGGMVAGALQQDAARALLAFLTSAATQQALNQKGFESF